MNIRKIRKPVNFMLPFESVAKLRLSANKQGRTATSLLVELIDALQCDDNEIDEFITKYMITR